MGWQGYFNPEIGVTRLINLSEGKMRILSPFTYFSSVGFSRFNNTDIFELKFGFEYAATLLAVGVETWFQNYKGKNYFFLNT